MAVIRKASRREDPAQAQLRKRFGELVRQRRKQRGMSQGDVTRAGGPSDSKQTQIERGDPPNPAPLTLKKLEVALGWIPGTAAIALAGGEPTPVGEAPTVEDLERRRRLVNALEDNGVNGVAARGGVQQGGRLAPETLDAIIEILERRSADKRKSQN